MAASGGGSTGANDPWGWLGLLKWSLSYSDGTTSSTASPMSEEDKKFLEEVMKNGIINENERMKEILKTVTEKFDVWKAAAADKGSNSIEYEGEDEVQDLLDELRDIVEQIDYARAFCSMKGLVFLLGCISEEIIPKNVRTECFGILATLCQHNPPVQAELLQLGAIKILSDLFFKEIQQQQQQQTSTTIDGQYCARIMQAISANVRSHETAENVFFQLEQSKELIESGLGMRTTTTMPLVVLKRTLFFLSALVTSDTSSYEQAKLFDNAIAYIIDKFILPPASTTSSDNDINNNNDEIREMSVALLQNLLEQNKSYTIIQQRKDNIKSFGTTRIEQINKLQGDDREFANVELEYWQKILPLLETQQPPSSSSNNNSAEAPPLMLGPSQTHTLPQ